MLNVGMSESSPFSIQLISFWKCYNEYFSSQLSQSIKIPTNIFREIKIAFSNYHNLPDLLFSSIPALSINNFNCRNVPKILEVIASANKSLETV